MKDARDFNDVLFDLVDGEVRRKNQFALPVHASGGVCNAESPSIPRQTFGGPPAFGNSTHSQKTRMNGPPTLCKHISTII